MYPERISVVTQGLVSCERIFSVIPRATADRSVGGPLGPQLQARANCTGACNGPLMTDHYNSPGASQCIEEPRAAKLQVQPGSRPGTRQLIHMSVTVHNSLLSSLGCFTSASLPCHRREDQEVTDRQEVPGPLRAGATASFSTGICGCLGQPLAVLLSVRGDRTNWDA